MKHYGDITKINGNEIEPVDIITGGSPCQDLSIAGQRAGLDGARSGLFMEQLRIIKELRNGNNTVEPIRRRPRYMVWENVPGALSSNNGEDFRIVLEETARVVQENAVIPRLEKGQKWRPSGCVMGDGWSIAWRVHDAQFWGVPQRRRRIALVADFGGSSAPEILFESEGLSRDIEAGVSERQETAGVTGDGSDKTSGITPQVFRKVTRSRSPEDPTTWAEADTTNTLNAFDTGEVRCNEIVVQGFDAYNQALTGNKSMTMTGVASDAHHIPSVVTYGLDRASFNQGANAQFDFSVEEDIAPTVVSRGPGGVGVIKNELKQ